MMTQCYGKIWYLLYKDVWPGKELLIYYGEEYARRLNIDIKNYHNADIKDPAANVIKPSMFNSFNFLFFSTDVI